MGARHTGEMDEPSTPRPGVPPRRLDPAAPARAITCPACGRSVEAGFTFCDGCGTRLEAVSRPARPVDRVPPLLEPLAPADTGRGAPRDSIGDRVRGRLGRLRRDRTSRPEPRPFPRLDDVNPAPPEAPTTPASGAVSKVRPAEQLRGARPAIAGRVRWVRGDQEPASSESDTAASTIADEPYAGMAAPPRDQPADGRREELSALAFQIAISFLAGGILLLVVTALASVASDGGIAVLETRGLPIFIGGSASVVVFALIRTASTRPMGTMATRRSALVTVIVGLVVLVLAAAILYQPAIASRVQPRIERVLKVFGSEDEQAVKTFEQAVVGWNEQAGEYHERLEAMLQAQDQFDRFRADASATETSLADLVEQMRSAARSAKHPGLRDALQDLASIYDDQLGGLRLVNRGLLVDSIDLVRRGDTRFKDAQGRARQLFDNRLRELLERGGFDASSLGNAISG